MSGNHQFFLQAARAALVLGVWLASPWLHGAHFIRGDADGNGVLQISDAVSTFGYLFLGENEQVAECLDAADTDDNGRVNLGDGIATLGFLFLAGPAPLGPFPDCGPDRTFEDGIGCDSFVPCALSTPLVVRGPQVALVKETSLTIAWRSDDTVVGTLEYAPYDPDFSFETSPTVQRASDDSATLHHVVALANLLPGREYLYRILHTGTVVSEGHRFFTVPQDPLAPVRIAVIGDSGTSSLEQYAVAGVLHASMPDLVIHTGDVVYQTATPERLDPAYFEPYRGLIDRIPFYLSLGNHDVRAEGAVHLLESVILPVNDRTGTEHFYSFDRGNVHLIALNSNTDVGVDSEQREWLSGDLAATTAGWIVVFFHHPPYSSSLHGSSTRMQALVPLFDAHDVDFVFSGHDHNFERTFPLLGGEVTGAESEPNYLDPEGTIYIVSGGAGRRLYGSGVSDFTAYSESAYHFVALDINGLEATVQAIRIDGEIIDTATVVKTQ